MRTFWTAVSRLKGGSGGRDMQRVLDLVVPIGTSCTNQYSASSPNWQTSVRISVSAPQTCSTNLLSEVAGSHYANLSIAVQPFSSSDQKRGSGDPTVQQSAAPLP